MTTEYTLQRWIWTAADFEQMGWHDATVHAMAFGPGEWEFALDLDYILAWVEPAEGERHFRFWVAPATLVFENVSELRIDLEPQGDISLQDLIRGDRQPTRPGFEGAPAEWQWTLDCNEGAISLRATGFRQTFRQAPVLLGSQNLELARRGGISFGERSAAEPQDR